MKRIFLVICLLGVAWARPNYQKFGYVTGDGVNLREGPGPSHRAVATLARGDWLALLEFRDGWVRVVPTQVWVLTENVTADDTVGPAGADLLMENRAGATVLGHLEPGTKLDPLNRGETFSLVEAPAKPALWVAQQYVTRNREGVQLRPAEVVSSDRFGLAPADLRKVSGVPGLRMLVLPTENFGTPHLVQASTGSRSGPVYVVKYQIGGEYFEITGATFGLGGPALNKPLYLLHTPLLGKVLVGTEDYGGSQKLIGILPSLQGGSTQDGRPCSLSLDFHCSPGWTRPPSGAP